MHNSLPCSFMFSGFRPQHLAASWRNSFQHWECPWLWPRADMCVPTAEPGAVGSSYLHEAGHHDHRAPRRDARRCGSSPHSATNLTCGKNQRRFETASTLKVLQVFTGSHASWAAGVEPLCLKVISCLTFGGTGSLCSTPVAPLYIPTSNARGFYFLHSLAKTHFPFFFFFFKNYTCLCRCEVIGRF